MNIERAKMSVGKGWHKLIDELYEKKPKDVEITYIKEKYGTLRVELDGNTTNDYWDIVLDIETKSGETCEFCGEKGEERDLPWILTLCEDCYKLKKEGKLSTG